MVAYISVEKECRRISCKDKGKMFVVFIGNAVGIYHLFCTGRVFGDSIVYILVAIISTGVIFLMAPVENNKKYLDQTEQKVYRKRTRIILLLEWMLFIPAVLLNLEELIIATTIAFFIVCTSLLAGRVKLQMHMK